MIGKYGATLGKMACNGLAGHLQKLTEQARADALHGLNPLFIVLIDIRN